MPQTNRYGLTTIDTTQGRIAGVRGRRSRRGTIAWRGIPYAAAPVGRGRFASPQPMPRWSGVRPCTRFGDALVQDKWVTATGLGRFQPMSEDCLTLNVFCPDTPPESPRPVMVFIHGGAYSLGAAATPLYDGTHLARSQGVVVVSIQYRFGAFGMLDFSSYSTPDRRFDQNVGLQDQVAALQWVQHNIGAFGGDRGNVTVFGESAGGAAVLTLLATPAARGLFVRAIAESPAADLVVSQDDATLFADEFLRLLADPTRRVSGVGQHRAPMSAQKARALLDGASAQQLHLAGNRLQGYARHSDTGDPFPFGPVVGGAMVPQSPLDAARDGATTPVPLIIGTNRDEGMLFDKFWKILPDPQRTLLRVADTAVRDEIVNSYAPDAGGQVRLAADGVFWAPTVAFAEAHRTTAPTYVYRYDFVSKALARSGVGATHATELLAVFGAYRMPLFAPLAAGDWRATGRITAQMQQRWADFARVGVPGADWTTYDDPTRPVLIIDRTTRVVADPDGRQRDAWARGRNGALGVAEQRSR